MHRLLREPLLHFFLLGALLFGLYTFLHRNSLGAGAEIDLTQGQFNSIVAQHEALWGRPPDAAEVQGLIDDWVHDEVLYREGMSLGLDNDDPIVRRRIEQKVEFIGNGNAPVAPTTADLQAWLDKHPDDYRTEARFTLRQVYFDRARHATALDADVAAARKALQAGQAVTGDASSLPPAMNDVDSSEIKALFGTTFESALIDLPIGSWQGPVNSGLGVHLVRLEASAPGHVSLLSAVRANVERDVMHSRELAARDAFYQSLRARYTVRIDANLKNIPAPAVSATPVSTVVTTE